MGVHVVKHYGVLGMHWGQHKQTAAEAIKVVGQATNLKANKTKKAYKQQTFDAGGLHLLTNKELDDMIKRMEMERKYIKFMQEESKSRAEGLKAAGKILETVGKFAIPLVLGYVGAKKVAPVFRTVSQYQKAIG